MFDKKREFILDAFTIPVVSKPGGFSGAVVIPGVVHTNYDKFSTLPYLQLTGWTYNDALNLVGIIFLAILISQLPRLTPLLSLAPTIKRSKIYFISHGSDNN